MFYFENNYMYHKKISYKEPKNIISKHAFSTVIVSLKLDFFPCQFLWLVEASTEVFVALRYLLKNQGPDFYTCTSNNFFNVRYKFDMIIANVLKDLSKNLFETVKKNQHFLYDWILKEEVY